MADEIGRKIDATATETTKKVKSFFAGLDLYTTIAVIAALAMALFGNLFVFLFYVSHWFTFTIVVLGALAIGFAIYMEMTQYKMSFGNLPLWMKVSLWIGVYVFVTFFIYFIKIMSTFALIRNYMP